MTIPINVEQKIKFICSKIWDTEWSGILFYNYEGTFEEGNLNIICQDILPMDIGSSTYTEFTQNPEVVAYALENDLLDCQMSLIHSHCTFSTFFSSTDLNTLLEEGSERNIFVSLIVNNKGDYTAAITRKVVSKINEDICYKTFNDKELCSKKSEEVVEYVEWFELDITKEEVQQFDDVKERLLKIAEDKKKKSINNNPIVTESKNTKPGIQTSMFNNKEDNDDGELDWDDWYLKPYSDANYQLKESKCNPYKPSYSNSKPNQDALGTYNIELLNDIVLKLLTGDITANSHIITRSQAAVNMKSTFDNTFKDTQEFDEFTDYILQYIVETLSDKVVLSINPEYSELDKREVFAERLSGELINSTTNKYINSYIEYLTTYYCTDNL